ncbi:hypothetical protein Y1Q_0011246 [Alligator mississippiensis]|uniref:Uncharacterized protein n=1 Tax=Alligator mississippiensis TaxID=8496 RepID=A0A151N7V8_ALLMI|nr:hypothetical protein Y1Q_0011246 [Alligator mississippiensis]
MFYVASGSTNIIHSTSDVPIHHKLGIVPTSLFASGRGNTTVSAYALTLDAASETKEEFYANPDQVMVYGNCPTAILWFKYSLEKLLACSTKDGKY